MSNVFAIAAALAAAAVLDGMNGVTRHVLRCAVLLVFVGALGHALGNAAADSLAFSGMAAFLLADRRGDAAGATYMYMPFAAASAALRGRLRLACAVAAMSAAAAITVCEWFA